MTDSAPTSEWFAYVHAQPDAVWPVLTDVTRQADWYLPGLALDGHVGGRVAWGYGSAATAPDVEGEVEVWAPDGHQLAHSFAFTFLDEPASRVSWEITAMGEVSQVWLLHDLTGRPQTNEIVGHSWHVMLARLKTLVETGKVMPEPVWPDR